MTRDLGRVGGSQAGRHAARWAGGFAALLLAVATPAMALQQARPVATTTVPTVAASSAAAPRTYAECLRSYAGRTNATAVCQRLFPNATPSSTTAPTDATTPTTPPREPVDITPQLDKLLDAWRNRPKTPPATPTDPLAVIPGIQAACGDYAAVPERWRRCAADGWRKAGFRGQPPLVLQNPPAVEPPPVTPPVTPPPVVQPPAQPPVVQPRPPIQTTPPLTPRTVEPEPEVSAPVAVPEPPPAAVVPPTPAAPPAVVPAPAPGPPSTPIWFWLIALAAAAGVGFGVAKLLSRARPPRPSKVAPAPCPEITLVADPGVVVLTPDGPPRAGMAVSLRFEHASDGGEVALDYPKLETAP